VRGATTRRGWWARQGARFHDQFRGNLSCVRNLLPASAFTPCVQILSNSMQSMLGEITIMGRGILLWLLGVPIPIIILLALIWH